MAVSNSTDFSSTAVEIIEDARRLLGIHAEEEPLQAHELVTGQRFLTRLLKAWQVKPDLGTWLETDSTLALVASDRDYVFGAGGSFVTIPFEIVSIRISYNGANEIPMTPMGRQEYNALPNKTSTGFPTQYFYDRQRDNGTLYVWPVPADNNYDIAFTYRRRIMDVDAGTDNLDIPPEWEAGVVANLAQTFIPIYGVGGTPEAQQVMVDAASLLKDLIGFDASNDNGSVEIVPDAYDRRDWR